MKYMVYSGWRVRAYQDLSLGELLTLLEKDPLFISEGYDIFDAVEIVAQKASNSATWRID